MRFLKDKVFVTAPSDAINSEGDCLRLENAVKNFKKLGYNVEIGQTVKIKNKYDSEEYKLKSIELENALKDPSVDIIISANGGDKIIELVPFLNFEDMKKSEEKIVQGFSDNAVLLFLFTTILNWKTYYAPCFPTFGFNNWDETIKNNLEMLRGNIIEQKSSTLYETKSFKKVKGKELQGYNLDTPNNIFELNGLSTCTLEGTMIGGCLDVIRNLVGTKYDYVKQFNEKNEKVIWYIENCSMNLQELEECLEKMIENNWFYRVNVFMIGRGKITLNEEFFKEQNKMLLDLLGKYKVPILVNCDFGHVRPFITLINGAVAKLEYNNGKYKIFQSL